MRNRDTVSVQLEKYPAVVRGFSINIYENLKESKMHQMSVFTEPRDTEDHALPCLREDSVYGELSGSETQFPP